MRLRLVDFLKLGERRAVLRLRVQSLPQWTRATLFVGLEGRDRIRLARILRSALLAFPRGVLSAALLAGTRRLLLLLVATAALFRDHELGALESKLGDGSRLRLTQAGEVGALPRGLVRWRRGRLWNQARRARIRRQAQWLFDPALQWRLQMDGCRHAQLVQGLILWALPCLLVRPRLLGREGREYLGGSAAPRRI